MAADEHFLYKDISYQLLEFGAFLTFIPPHRREMLISMTPLFF
jgi:hypothetical protein